MANIHFDDVRVERFALGQERLANKMAQLIHAMQNLNGEGSSSKANNNIQPPRIVSDSSSRSFWPTFLPRKEVIPVVETQHSVGHNIAASYEEYRALPAEIRDALSLAEFIGVNKGRARQGPRSQAPQKDLQHAWRKEEEKNFQIAMAEQEEKSGLQVMEREQPMEESTMPKENGKDVPAKEEKDSPLVIRQEEEIIKQEQKKTNMQREGKDSLTINDVLLISNDCMWRQDGEGKSDLQEVHEAEIRDDPVERHALQKEASPDTHVGFQSAGIYISATNGKQFNLLHHPHTMYLQGFDHHENYSNKDERMKGTKGKKDLFQEAPNHLLSILKIEPRKEEFNLHSYDNDQLAGIFKTTAHKRQVEGVHDFGKDHEEAPCTCQQNMDEVKVGRASLVEYEEISTMLHSAKEDEQVEDNPRYDIENYISVFWSLPMSLPYLCHHGQLVEKNEPMSSLMLHSIMGGHHGQHSGHGDKVKNTLSGDFYVNCNEDTDLVLGVPWLHSLGKFTQDYQIMELRLKLDGQEVVLPSMTHGIPQVATAKRRGRNFWKKARHMGNT
ncbi:hypothetical protein KI387_039413 [Taxus chinensis]|uniref:Uncharacterized protein n=1 Tax=Taxus chinensis TaxID=29808 RepID=A0AA38FBI5_TAXCH|nr:hypothetical protein KI387_039413 [Taxus chinensis]